MAPRLGDAHEAGQTPLDSDEIEGLRIPVGTRAALNEVEAENIAIAVSWVASRRLRPAMVLDEAFLKDLHRRMFGQVWTWAGAYRRSDKNLGVPWYEVAIHVHRLIADAGTWVGGGMAPDESAVRFGHRIVAVHPFPNGNGRHSRLASDCLAMSLGRPVFTWGAGRPPLDAGARGRYLEAVRAADDGDIDPLLAFARG